GAFAQGGDAHMVHPIIEAAAQQVAVPVIVHVTHGHDPLLLAVVHGAIGHQGVGAVGVLIVDAQDPGLVQEDHVVQSVAVHVHHADAPATVGGAGLDVGGVDEGEL